MNKKTRPNFKKIVLFSLFVLVVLFLRFTTLAGKKAIDQSLKNQNIQKEQEDVNKITIQGVKMRDFYKYARPLSENSKDVMLVDEKNYDILYFAQSDEFLVSILGYPFADILPTAEDAFLQVLEISKDDACRLTVHVTTTLQANPNLAGQIMKLSFCEN